MANPRSQRECNLGKFTIDQYDEAGNLLAHVQGNVIGTRVTMETGFQEVEWVKSWLWVTLSIYLEFIEQVTQNPIFRAFPGKSLALIGNASGLDAEGCGGCSEAFSIRRLEGSRRQWWAL
jgi:hypothetical protein